MNAETGAARRVGSWRIFVVSLVCCFGVTLTWAAATPMFGVPDEVSHMIRAAAAARGDIDGTKVGSSRAYRAPAVLEPTGGRPDEHSGVCYAADPNKSPDCMGFTSARGDRLMLSSASEYPPLFYLLVGWPTRVSRGLGGLYAMRAVGALVFSALIALGMTSLGYGRQSATAFMGLAIALTPMVWFLSGSVNPSSMAIASGVAAWCGGYRLATGEGSIGLRSQVWRVGLPICLLLLSRRDSLVWAALLSTCVVTLVSRPRLLAILRSPHSWIWVALAGICVVSVWKTGIASSTSFVADQPTGSASEAFGAIPRYLQEMIGVLGWFDTRLPSPVYLVWYMTCGFLVLSLFGSGPRRVVLASLLTFVLMAAMIVVVGSQRYPYFQGRYALPLAVGIPLLSGLGLEAKRASDLLSSRAVLSVLSASAVVHWLAFYQQFRRYATSGETSWWLFSHPHWEPPVAPIAILLVVHGVILAAMTGWWYVSASVPDAVLDAPPEPARRTRFTMLQRRLFVGRSVP